MTQAAGVGAPAANRTIRDTGGRDAVMDPCRMWGNPHLELDLEFPIRTRQTLIFCCHSAAAFVRSRTLK